jgi:hypothetical protein
VPDHVHSGARLLQDDVANERLVTPVLGLHLDEDDFAEDAIETLDLDADRSNDLPANEPLIRSFHLDRSSGG